MDILEDIARVSIRLLLREPFYAHILSGLSKEVSAGAPPTLAVDAREDYFVLLVHPDYWEQLTDPEHRCGLLLHEVLHLLFRHPLRAGDFLDLFIFDIAADLVVNQCIDPAWLPAGALYPDHFPELDLAAQQTTADYYEKLYAAWAQPDTRGCRRLLSLFEKREEVFAGHTHWRAARSVLDAALLDRELGLLVKQARQRVGTEQAGRLPERVREAIGWWDEVRPARVDWRRVLRLFVSNSSRTRLKNTIRRPSKRYGTTPGIALQRQHRLLVAVDVSGSIADADLQDFFNELYQLWRRGIEVRLLTFDNRVRSVTAYRGYPPGDLPGGGGTDFEPVLAYAHEQKGWDGLILLTDGRAPTPVTPCRLPLLWVVSRAGIGRDSLLFGALPGRAVKMNA